MGKTANIDKPLSKRISRILATPVTYRNFPKPIVYKSQWGYNRAKCPVDGCTYDGLVNGFEQHYARQHAPEQWGQHNKAIIKAVRQP